MLLPGGGATHLESLAHRRTRHEQAKLHKFHLRPRLPEPFVHWLKLAVAHDPQQKICSLPALHREKVLLTGGNGAGDVPALKASDKMRTPRGRLPLSKISLRTLQGRNIEISK